MSEIAYLVTVAVVFFAFGFFCGSAPTDREVEEARRRDLRDRIVVDLTQQIERKRERRPW